MSKPDIYRRVAAIIFNVPVECVTLDQRARAKTVRFGMTYGMSYEQVKKIVFRPAGKHRQEASGDLELMRAELAKLRSGKQS